MLGPAVSFVAYGKPGNEMEEGSETKKAFARAYTTEPIRQTQGGEKSSSSKIKKHAPSFFKRTETSALNSTPV